MNYSRRINLSPLRSNRWLSSLLVLAYILTSTGGPLPLAAVPFAATASTDSRPFPCQGHHCGCQSAEQCWSNCCCFSVQERLAWAKAHRVFVPELAKHDHDDHEHADHHVDQKHVHRGEHKSCCHARLAAHPKTSHQKISHKPAKPSFQTMKCHGIVTHWVTLGAVTAPPNPVEWTCDWTLVWTMPVEAPAATLFSSDPSVPPPRV